MLFTNSKTNIVWWLCLLFTFSCLQGCDDSTTPKKVSLHKRTTTNKTIGKSDQMPMSFKFGFDLRLDPKDDYKIYLPFIQYLTEATGLKFSIVFTADYEETIKNLGTGVTQFAFLGPLNCIRAKTIYGTGCLAMGKNTFGKKEYQAAIVSRSDSLLSNLEDLRGKSMAFGSRFSTQGHLIARYMLEQKGVHLEELSSYGFTGSHDNAIRAVLNGDFDAGAVQDGLAKKMEASGKIKILSMSKPFPASLVCYNNKVDPATLKKVQQALMDFDPLNKHADMLTGWNSTEMPAGFAEYNPSRLKEIETLSKKYGLLQ